MKLNKSSLLLSTGSVEFDNLVSVVQHHMHEHPERNILRFLADGENESGQLTYQQLDQKARAIALTLTDKPIIGNAQKPCALLAFSNGIEFITSFYACLYAGIIAVPVYPPQHRPSYLERLNLIAEDSQASFILGMNDYLSLVDDKYADHPALNSLTRIAVDQVSVNDGEQFLTNPELIEGDDIAFLQYTSGSTSNPKGVMVTHQNLLHNIMCMQQRFEYTEDSVIVSWLPMFHDMGLIGAVLQSISIGATCIAMTPAAFLQKPMRWLDAIHNYRGTASYAPNFAYDLCVSRAKPEDIARLDLSCWRIALNGSEPIRPDTLDSFLEAFSAAGFSKEALYPAYGLAEGTLFVSGSQVGSGAVFIYADGEAYDQQRKIIEVDPNSSGVRRLASSGQPSDHHLVLIVNPDTHNVCEEGEIGEVWMCSQSSAFGYWKNPEQTAETFHATVKGKAAQRYAGKFFMRTGDFGFLHNKELTISGRIKEVIIIRGANYYPQAIEESVQKALPALKDNGGAAFTVNSQGQEQLVLVQEVERTYIKKLDKAEAFATAKRVIGEDFGLQLVDMVIIRPATLPKTSSGKIQRTKAQQLYQQQELAVVAQLSDNKASFDTESGLSETASANTIPTLNLTSEEEALCNMLRMVLATHAQVDMQSIAVTQDVMSLGLDSLAVINVSQSIQMMTGIELPLVELLTSPTVIDVARMIIHVRKGGKAEEVLTQKALASANNGSNEAHSIKKPKAAVAELSLNQQQLWLLQDKAPNATAYNVPICLKGDFTPERVDNAWQQVTAANSVLRAQLAQTAEGITQSFNGDTCQIEQRSEPATFANITAVSRLPFDINGGELLRVHLWKNKAQGQDVVLVNVHHIVVDMLSMLTIVEQFLGLLTGKVTELVSPSVDYQDFVQWQQTHAQQDSQFWQEQLQKSAPVLQWPLRTPRADRQSFAGDSVDFSLTVEQSQLLKKLAKIEKTTVNTVILSIYQTFLAKLCYQREFAIGVLNTGRPNADYNHVVGYFVQPAPFMVALAAQQNKQLLIQQTHGQMLQVIRHQHSAIAALLNHHDADTPAGVPPVFQTLFSYYPRLPLGVTPFLGEQDTSVVGAFPDYQILHLPSSGAQLDLSLLASDTGEQIALRFEYNIALFDHEQVAQFAASFCQVANDFVTDDVTHLGQMSLLPREQSAAALTHETASIARESNLASLPTHTVIEQIWENFERYPNAQAVVINDAELTYAGLKQQVQQIAVHLSPSVKQGDVVALCCERSSTMISSILAVMSLGAAYLPLDAQQPIERLHYCLETAQAAVLITHQPCVIPSQKLQQHSERSLTVINLDDAKNLSSGNAPAFQLVPSQMADSAYVIFTSGSTGKPKGVVNTHLGLSNRLQWMAARYHVDPHARILQKTPYTFDVSVWELLLPLLSGGTLVFAKPEGHKDARYLRDLIAAQRVNRLHFVPSMLDVFIDELSLTSNESGGSSTEGKAAQLHCVTQIFCSGEALSKPLQQRVNTLLPWVELHNLYGPTEAAIDVTAWHCQPSDSHLSVPIGKAIDNTALYALDHDGMPVPAGIMGELFISGYGLAKGYINRDDLTAERFVQNPFFTVDYKQADVALNTSENAADSAYQRMYQTGDLVRYHTDGVIEYLGRTDSQVKVRGFRIELAEIDARLSGLTAIKEAVTIVNGQAASARLVSYVVLHPLASATDETQLKAALAAHLPSYMLPDRIVTLEQMPVTANGKLDRRALPDVSEQLAQTSVTPLHTEAEHNVAKVFSQWLTLDCALLGRESHFFTLGGHSLLAAKVIQQLNTEHKVALRLKDLFDAPTIGALALRLAQPAAPQQDAALNVTIQPTEQPLQHLSASQSRLWFHYQLEGPSAVYNIPCILALRGSLNPAVLQQSVDALIARHPILHSCYQANTSADKNLGEMSARPLLDCPVLVQTVPNKNALDLALANASETPFALDSELPIRVRLITVQSAMEHTAATNATGDSQYCHSSQNVESSHDAQHSVDSQCCHYLVICLHHIVADGQTLSQILNEISAGYAQALLGDIHQAPSVLGYQDFVAWQQQWLHSSQAAAEVSYWKQNLAELPALLPLPYDFPRPAKQSTQGDSVRFTLPRQLSQQLQQAAVNYDVSLYMLLLGAFNMLLARFSQQTDIAVGTPILGRPTPALDNTIGYFANTLVIRQNLGLLTENATIADVLAQLKQQVLAATEHQWLPFDQLVEQLQPERSLSYSPLFQVMFSLTHQDDVTHLFNNNASQIHHREHHLAKFDLSLMLETQGTGDTQEIGGYFEFATGLFTRQTIQTWLTHFTQLLSSLADIDERERCEWRKLSLLSDTQQQQICARGAGPTVDYAQQNVLQRFAEQVKLHGDQVACVDANQPLTYQQLAYEAAQVAQQLVQQGVQPGQPVLLVTSANNSRLVSLLAIVMVGAYYVPLDANNPPERNVLIAEKTQATVLLHSDTAHVPEELTQGAITALAVSASANSERLNHKHSLAASQWQAFAGWQSDINAPSYLMFTSGSTGEPKGTLIPQRGILRLVTDASFMTLNAQSIFLHAAPLAFDASTLEIWGPLLNGGQVVMSQERVPTPSGLQQLVQQHHVNCAWLTASLFNHLIDQDAACVAGLAQLLVGGDVVSAQHVTKAYAANAELQLINGYGPTETTTFAVCYPIPRQREYHDIAIGLPIQATQIYIVDEQLQLQPEGAIGELLIGGAGLALAYLGREQLTAEKFIADPFLAGGMVYRTGDLVRRDSTGCIHYLGRNDQQVKLRGFRIELSEINQALLAFPEIEKAATVVAGDKHHKQLVAFVVLTASRDAAEQTSRLRQIQKQLGQQLPSYMLPSALQALTDLPLTVNGKLDQKALPAVDWLAWQQGEYAAPINDTERSIAECWANYFGMPAAKISRFSGFFELGGHSLLAAKFSQWAETTLHKKLSVSQVFATPNLADLAEQLTQASVTQLSRIPTATQQTLSFAQQRLLFIEQANEPSAVYNIPFFLYFAADIDSERLQAALITLLERHQVLRTRFAQTDSGNQLVVEPSSAWQWQQRSLPTELQATLSADLLKDSGANPFTSQSMSTDWQRYFSEFAHQPFDVFADIPFRAEWLALNASGAGVLLVNVHHIAFDGWSQEVFLKQLERVYHGEEIATDIELQYQDYAAWQHEQSHNESQQQQLHYWQQQLQGLPPLLDLPTDYPRPVVQQFTGDCLAVSLPLPLSQQIQQFSAANGLSPYMTLLAGFWLLLAKQSGEDDIAVGSPVANREHPQTADLVGFFANTIVLRGLIDNNSSIHELLAQTKATVLAAQQHQSAPFEQVVEALNPPRSTAYSPVFQVMFSMLHQDNASAQFGEPFNVAHRVSKFDLSFMLHRQGEQIEGYIEYNTALFNADTLRDYWQRFQFILTQMLSTPSAAIAQVSLAPQAHLLTQQLAQQPEPLAFDNETVFVAISKQVSAAPNSIAIIDGDGGMSYATLWEQATNLAAYLQHQGVQEGSAVAVYLPRNAQLLVSLVAIQLAGGFYVPLDPKYPAQRSENILASAKPVVVISIAALHSEIESLCRCEVLTLNAAILSASGLAYREPTTPPEHLAAYAIYTSGSTGLPKGIAIHHRNVMAMLRWAQAEFSPHQRQHMLAATSICFDLSVFELFLPLIGGHTVTIVDDALSLLAPQNNALNPKHQQAYMAQGVAPLSLINTVPSAMDALVAADVIPSSVNTINLAGEPLSRALVDRIYALGHVQQVINLYGPSEDTTYSTIYRVPAQRNAANWHEKPLIGQPIRNTRAYVLDAGGNLVPDGVAGELYLAGEGVAHGYLGQPELSKSVFMADRFTKDGSQMYRTGDKVRRLANGELDYLGRLDFQVKLRGFRIELGEIEAIAAQVAEVREAVAVVNSTQGDNLVLFVRWHDAIGTDAVSQKLSATLPDYMQPAAIETLSRFPTLPNGKIDRSALKQAQVSGLQSQRYVPPTTETEHWLAQTWQHLLGGKLEEKLGGKLEEKAGSEIGKELSSKPSNDLGELVSNNSKAIVSETVTDESPLLHRIGREDNFFALGGHSLLATQLVTRIRQHYHLEVPIKNIFQHPELHRQATMLDLLIASQLLVNGNNSADDADFEEGTI